MDLDTYYQENAGKVVSFDGIAADAGQCLQWVSLVNRDVYGGQPFYTSGAIDWYNKFSNSPLPNTYDRIPVGPYPIKGDLVVFGTGVGSVFGHIDVCMQDGNAQGYQGSDSNWGGNLTVHLVQHNYNNVLGYLRPKEQYMTPQEVSEAYSNYAGLDVPAGSPPTLNRQPLEFFRGLALANYDTIKELQATQTPSDGTVLSSGKYIVK